ncbi:dynein heavy chain 2, axonemal [Nasonia vitripennis]|uniref:Dynein axonemal heavy chain 2 n=1 Tax=Nasonia vitripennis TaxID=7425 RepID=A0A7M7H5X5_NASVI|nr:dynein heavy chain 2, axonemal [Nasonia vitripennis]
MLGLTVIYQPREACELIAEEASADKELVKRLEGVVVHWLRQIRIALGDQDQSTVGELLCFKDEYDFWLYRYDNLRGLRQQLETKCSRGVLSVLGLAHSTHLRQLQLLIEEIERATREAKSNVEFLAMLEEPCLRGLGDSRRPIDLLDRLAEVIQISRVIWMNSPYLGNERRMTRLFEVIGNQVIEVCRNAVNLDELFSGMTRKTMEMLLESIDVCQRYKDLYHEISRAHNKLTHHKWELRSEQVFRYVDAFVVRCQNLVEISQAMIDFARMDETNEMPRIRFNGTKGPEHERMCLKIEQRFSELLSWLRRISPKILDVRQSTWYDDMSLFRSEIRKLELAVENLMEDAFEEAGNIEDSLQTLHGFRYFMRRENLQKQFDMKIGIIWQMLDTEIQTTKQEIISEKSEYPSFSPYFAGRALNLKMKSDRLTRLSLQLRECTWQRSGDPTGNEAHAKAFHHCNALVESIAGQIADLYRKWLAELGDNPQSRLDRYLMRRVSDACGADDKARLLECNVDPRLLSLCKEAGYWLDLRFELPVSVQLINGRWRSLQFVYENVLAIVGAYNKIIQALSDEEKPLFRELIRQVDKKIRPGLTKLTWKSDYIEDYIKDCNTQTAKLQEFIDTYKKCNLEIFKICESICGVVMIKIRHNHVYELDELLDEMETSRNEAFDIFMEKYKLIVKYLLVVYEGFQPVIEHCLTEWKLYLLNFDKLLKEAFKLSIKNSLLIMYESLHGDGTVSPSPILQLKADLVNNKINFTPSLTDVAQMVSNFFHKLLDLLKIIPSVVEKFELHDFQTKPYWKAYLEDEDLDRSRQMSNNEVSYCFTQVQNYLTTWEPFRDIWEVNKDLFIQRYEKLKPTVALFDADIGRYAEVANNVQMQETVVTVHFLEINVDRLKAAIVQQCSLWQQKLTGLLLELTEGKVHHIYKYVADNGKRITKEPMDLITMQAALQLFERLAAEIPMEEKEFPTIRQQYETLEKYEVSMTLELKRKIRDLDECWTSYLELVAVCELTLLQKKEEFKNKLIKEDNVLKENVKNLLQKFYESAPFTSDWKTKDARAWLQNMRKKVNKTRDQLNKLKKDLSIFSISQPDSTELNTLLSELTALELVWELTDEWEAAWKRYKYGNFWSIEIDEMDETANVLFRKLTRLSRELKEKNWSIVDSTRSRVDNFRRTLPLIIDLKNPAMRDRHWTKVMQSMGTDFDQKSDEFTLDAIAAMQMHNFAEEIADISNSATMELAIETGLKNISEIWKAMPLIMVPYKENGIYRLKTVDDIMQALEEHQVQLSAMKSTKFVDAFAAEVDYWERALSTVGEILEMVLSVQKSYMYLDNIFSAEDIRKQLPQETDDFDKLTASWKEITWRMASSKLALQATLEPPGLLDTLNELNNKLEAIQRELEQYLETKRHVFPRFYFISNDDLLEILANSKKPELIQPHIKKLFDGIKHIKLGKSVSGKAVAEGMSSSEGEYTEFLEPVLLEGQVEVWLCYIESAMRRTLREVLRQCRAALRKMSAKRDKWVKEWQSQSGITSTQIQWTSDCTRVLQQCKLLESKKPLKKLKKRQNQALAKYSEAVRGKLDRLQRLKFKAIVVIEIHARDVIERMYKSNCRDVSSFEWLSQLRFYWDRDVDDCVVRQTNTSFVYGYEYLGNSERLVITPLTDRCYITLTTALHLHRGGSPKGPAGTGKTETVKDLGKALGFNVIVVNCSEGLDYKSMGRMFSGLAQTGAWGCFDEFNRINIEVLSVVAQQILSILTALSQKLTRFVFEGTEISLVSTCGIFITMNPGYAGRTELPDNLKSMFRPISMMVPDSSMIAEINLFGEGFQNTRSLAKKVDTLYALAKQQLSKQFHYDFGLRGIVTLTRYAGKKRRQYPNLPDEEVVILAMKDMNIAKLTTDDLPLFIGITSDLFPGIQVPTVDYDELIGYITNEAIKLKLQPIPALITKVIELYETKNSRHSTMIVGQSNTGKSATWRTLQNTLTTMKRDGKPGFNVVHEFPINPKALNLGELYGEYNLSTGEWSDGVISSIMRKTCADQSPDEKWIIFDGPVDAVWIENMNSVMDDNKILTLINNDRITLPEQVSLLFEVEDLAVASPATVSRAGMVYNDYKDLGWRPYVDSWLEKYKNQPEFIEEMNQHFDTYVDKVLEFKRSQCNELITLPEPNAVQSLCKLLEVLATPQNGVELLDDRDAFNSMCKLWFFFCMIWSLCASVDEEGRQKMDNFVREMEGAGFPLRDTVYEYYVDVRQRGFVSWEEKLSPSWKFPTGTPFYKITVPTVDTIRYDYLVNVLLTNGFPVLLVGPVGTGKTSTAQSVVGALDPHKYSLLVLNMSAQTSSRNVQEAIESRVEKRTKGIFVPGGGKTMIAYMDDFNMPMKDTYGSQPPLELIRQWIGYGFWYDRQNQSQKFVQKMQLIGSMGPPGGGRNTVTNRLISKFNLVNMTFPAEKQIARIYGTMLNQQLLDFHQEVKALASDITMATIGMYNSVVLHMLPTPMKMHYLFNLRDISKVFQGLLRSHKDYQYSKQSFLRLWIHETFRVFNDRLVDDQDREWFVSALNEQLGQYFESTFHGLCPEKRCPIFGSFMNAWNIYEDLRDVGAVRSYAEGQMDEHNATAGVVRLDLILFRDAVEHICRIVRVISEPRGNMLLVGIGGSGRQSLSRLAAYMCELTTFQIEVSKHYHVPEFREDLKSLYYLAGVENKPSSFLFNDTQIVEEQFLEIVNNMLSTGEIASLYKSDELEDIKNKLSKDATKAGISPTAEAIYQFLIQRVRANLHVILCMSPIGDAFRNRLRQYPALINCTSIDWFHEWPREALLEVGNKFLMNLDFTLTITGDKRTEEVASETPAALLEDQMRGAIASTFSLIHDTVSQFSRRMSVEMKRYNYVTPTNFLELVAGYKQMLGEKRLELSEQANKLRNGLFKLDDTREKVNEMAVELAATQQQVQRSTAECEEYLVSIVSQRRDADETQKLVTARSVRIAEESKVCKRLEEIARADLATVEPALQEAMMALDALSKKDISEIKSFTRPPARVEMVLEAVMILKNSEPTWAESKRQLGDVNFINTLRDFDKDHISDKTLRTISKYTSNPEFEPEKVGIVSNAAKSLSMWVIAMEQYGKLYRIVAPKREKLEAALASLREKETALAEARAQLQKLQEELERLQQVYDAKMKEKEDLISLEELLKLKLERAAMLVDGLSGERVRWESSVRELDGLFDSLPGDCLIATAFVSYLGPFVSNYRDELVRIWTAEVLEKEIPSSRSLDVKEFLSDPTTIREWNIQGLPSDDFSTENGIIITRGTRWPLVIDPQAQAAKWIRNMETKNTLRIIDFGQPDFAKILEHAIQFGKPVLLQNVGETLEPVMDSVLQKAFIKTGNQVMIKFNDKMIGFNDKFRLFITTKLSNPHYAPEISTKTTLCNFAIKEQGLEAQLLGIVVRKEKPQLEEQKDNLVLTIATGKRNLKELEDKILYLLSVTSGSLLDDLDLLTTLQTSKSTAITIQESLVVSEETEKEIDAAREGYRACSKRASLLFFVLNDMSLIDPMYQFSLDAYISLFSISIDKSPKSSDLSERIDSLNGYHTYALYRNTCRGLFEQHKLLFSFHMCIKILEAQDKIYQSEYSFLLTGGIVVDRESQPDKPVAWLPDESWDSITELEKLPGFHGLVESFEQSPRDWHKWYLANDPETEPLVGEWEDRCNEFQKMLIIRSCRADRMTSCLRSFIVRNLGQAFVEPPVLDVKAVLDDSTARTPLIFVLSPGVDPTGALMQLAENHDMAHRFMTLSLGQGQAPIATRMIEIGSKEGAWVFLANCHLSLSWMPKLDKIVENLGNSKDVHPEFRLWLSSSPTPQFPISILQAGIKMTTEPPKGLRANMKRLYGLISEPQFEICNAKAKYKKLLFALVFFHSVLLERKKFQQLGWNVIYSFNDSDFEVSENLLQVYLDEYPETPWDALKYLIAGICYGGHVTDDWDRRLLMAYVEDYMNESLLNVSHYRLSSLPTYHVPRDGSLETYRDFINALPMTDRPEAFGQHPNADITSLIIETRLTFETLMSLQMQVVDSAETMSTEDRVIQLSQDIISKLPKPIDYERTERLIGPYKKPLDVVLLQEIIRYNDLLYQTRSSLEELCRAIQGLVVMSSELEEIFTCVQEGRVPSGWSRAYPSLKSLGAWTRDLVLRVEHFSKWAETTQPPVLFWLAAFTFPTGFLTAVLQTAARRSGVSIDTLSWEFDVFKGKDEAALLMTPPEDGVYVRSMFLEGAGWDRKLGALVDPAPMQLFCNMPVIHFKPTEQTRKKTRGLYSCPCYYYPQRCGDQGRPAYVVTVDLNAGAESAAFWTKRGTALLLSLAT